MEYHDIRSPITAPIGLFPIRPFSMARQPTFFCGSRAKFRALQRARTYTRASTYTYDTVNTAKFGTKFFARAFWAYTQYDL